MSDAERDFSRPSLLALLWATVSRESHCALLGCVTCCFLLQTMGGDLSGKSQNASKGIYAMACEYTVWLHWDWAWTASCLLREALPSSPGRLPSKESASIPELKPGSLCDIL